MTEQVRKGFIFRICLTAFLMLGLGPAGSLLPDGPFSGPAFADDDDDDDDDDDRERRRPPTRLAPPPRLAQTPASVPERIADELIAAGLSQAELDQLVASGYVIVARQPVAALGSEIVRLRIPASLALIAARDQLRVLSPTVDFNHYYRPQQAPSCRGRHCVAPMLVGWPIAGACSAPISIGLVDTGIDLRQPAFAGVAIETIALRPDGALPSGKEHGTAIAALLVGSRSSQTPGLLPDARLIAVDAFHRGPGADDRADAYDLTRAIDLLAARGVAVMNLSLAGPPNLVIETLIARLADTVTLVSSVGNQGPGAAPSYPAAYEQVIGVTGVDQRKRAYRRAGQGNHVDLAAPGVDVWVAAPGGSGKARTGTSFAVPFVAAAAAVGRSKGLGSAEVAAWLTSQAEDLGPRGHDPVYGAGLLDARAICG